MSHERLYRQRLARYVTAMRNEKPDLVPIRPFVAEFTAKYAGYTCQEVAHDYRTGVRRRPQVRRRFRLGRRRGQHGLRLDRPDAGDRAEVLRRSPASTCRPTPASSTCEPPRGPGLHAGRRVRPADRRPDRRSCSTSGCRGCPRTSPPPARRPAIATTCRSSRAAWR